jgi:hypothetical protein
MSAVSFLGDRLQMEDGTIANITRILKASSPKEIIDASRELACDLFGEEKLREFTSDVCKSFRQIENIQNIESSDRLYFGNCRLYSVPSGAMSTERLSWP